MTEAEARILLGVGQGPAAAAQFRDAYLRQAPNVRLDADPDTFMGLREAFELLTHGAGAPVEEIAGARDSLAAEPDAEDARWRLLSCLSYSAGPEASSVLRDGAEREPDAFLDELMFHFPDRVPPELARRARNGAGPARLLLIADVEATQGRPAQALEALGAALADMPTISSSALLRLAARPIFSLQAHIQVKPAAEALALLQTKMGAHALDGETGDLATVTMFKIAQELGRLDETFPLDLRQVAARAAKLGDFQNAPYEARFAARLMKPLEVGELNKRLKRDAPTLAGILGLSLTEEQLRPRATPSVLVRDGWSPLLILVGIFGSWMVHAWEQTQKDHRAFDELTNGLVHNTVDDKKKQIERDCADPGSQECRQWVAFVPSLWTQLRDIGSPTLDPDGVVNSAPSSPDVGIRLEDLPTIGKPGEPGQTRHRPRHHRQ